MLIKKIINYFYNTNFCLLTLAGHMSWNIKLLSLLLFELLKQRTFYNVHCLNQSAKAAK